MQGKLRKRAASSSRTRLEPLRKKLRHDQVLRETWEAIAQQRQRRTGQPATCERKDADEMTTPHVAQEKTVTEENLNQASAAAPQQRLYVYTCPFCHDLVTTPIASGHINHRRICGKQFRVHDGLLRPTLPTQHYSHACPTCGTSVQSTIKSGQSSISNPMAARAVEQNGTHPDRRAKEAPADSKTEKHGRTNKPQNPF